MQIYPISNLGSLFHRRPGTHRDPVHQARRSGCFVRRQPNDCARAQPSTDIVLPVLAESPPRKCLANPDFVEPTNTTHSHTHSHTHQASPTPPSYHVGPGATSDWPHPQAQPGAHRPDSQSTHLVPPNLLPPPVSAPDFLDCAVPSQIEGNAHNIPVILSPLRYFEFCARAAGKSSTPSNHPTFRDTATRARRGEA